MNVARDPAWANDWLNAGRLLCVRLDSLGDVLMTTPAIRALKQARGGRHVTLLTSPAGAEIARLVPQIDDVIVYAAPWLKATPKQQSSQPEREMIDLLRAGCFDGAVIFTVYSQNPLPSALLCYLADIPLRLALCHENPYQLLTHWQSDPEPQRFVRHEVRRQLDMVAAIGCRTDDERLSLHFSASARRRVQRMLCRLGLDYNRPWAVLHPGSTAPSRRYPASLFAEVATRLAQDRGYQLVLGGSDSERDLATGILATARAPGISLAGRLSLEELAALISLAPILIANNTGPVHIAAAVGTPVVDLYALTNPQHTPWKVPNRVLSHDVACKFCYKSVCPEGHQNCLRLVDPCEIVRAVEQLEAEGLGSAARAGAGFIAAGGGV
jgi:lipopolysaccharide heptosyltransferase II